MLSKELNDLLTQVGPETRMGQVFRRYWLPALLSEEVPEPDSPPVRVRILGENLVAFRDSTGSVGIVADRCPHRGAPMFFGRNEEAGLRCVYHGWKFDSAGNCVDMPSEPPESPFKSKVNIPAYPTWEAGGAVWVYMGPRAEMPPYPQFEWLRAPATHQRLSKTLENANYLQALEGGIDTAHSSFVHNNDLENKTGKLKNQSTHPRLEVETTDYGFRYAGLRELTGGRTYVRAYQFVMPFMQFRASLLAHGGERRDVPTINGHVWVPIDDEWTMVFNWLLAVDHDKPVTDEHWERLEKSAGRGPDDFIEGTYRLKRNLSNDYLIDREMQRAKTYTGITGLNTQDYAVQEGMGAINDRTIEHLGTSDKAIITARRLLRDALDDLAEGRSPLGADTTAASMVRPGEGILEDGLPWQEALKDQFVAEW